MKETTIDQTLVLCESGQPAAGCRGQSAPAPSGTCRSFLPAGGRQADRFLSALAPGGPLSVGRGAGSVRLRWVCGSTLAYNFSEAPAPRCAI